MITTDQLRKLIEEKKITLGTQATTKAAKAGLLKKVVLASNAPQTTRDAVNRYKAIAGFDVDELNVPNDELGVMCKKPFSISLLGIRK